jgi:hypothetical protein
LSSAISSHGDEDENPVSVSVTLNADKGETII